MSSPDPAGDTTGEVVYGLLTLGGVEVALPLATLREVVSCPAEFADLPVDTADLLGAMTLRKLVVPVVDLRPRLGAPAGRSDEQVVVVITHDDRVLGLLVDGVRDITRVPGADLRAVAAGDGPLLFSHTFRHPTLGGVVSVLDVPAVLKLPGVPTVHDPAAEAGGPLQVAERRAGRRRTLTLLRCGPHVLGIEVAHVHTTLAGSAARPSVLRSALCRGVTDFSDREVPVVDPLVLLGLGRLPADDPHTGTGAGLVLDLGHGYVVLALTAVLDITEVADADVLALPGFSVRRPDLIAGIADVDRAGQCLVLDGDALLAEPDLRAFAAVNTAVGGGEEASADAGVAAASSAGGGRAYLTYSVGVDVATPLEQVAEIVPFPATRTPTEVGDAVLGVVVHRRAAVPVLCLPTLLGLPRAPVTSATCLLLVEIDGDHVGFAVEALRAIDRLAWEEPRTPEAAAAAARTVPTVARGLRDARLVNIGDDTRLLPDLDLRALARAVRGELSGTAGAAREGRELSAADHR